MDGSKYQTNWTHLGSLGNISFEGAFLPIIEQINHSEPHGFPDVHVGFSIAVVMAARTTAFGQWVAVDCRYVAFELRITGGAAIHG
jgi:hypothetical protein